MYTTPILFIIFNRPDTTQVVFDRIKQIQPKYLFVAADGPRKGNAHDAEKCTQTRAIIEQVDWDCELKTLFRSENIGCGRGPAQAITWFFDQVEEGIILEDDCVPHLDFFPYCTIMLDKYFDNPNVLSIAGSNFQDGKVWDFGSYYFSAHNRIWGWAAWRKTWSQYDYYLSNMNSKNIKIVLNSICSSRKEYRYWEHKLNAAKLNQMSDSCWDYQFMYMLWLRNGLTVVPNVNLISNIGDGDDATHTVNWTNNPNLRRQTGSILPVLFNENIKRSKKADKYYISNYILMEKSIIEIILRKFVSLKKIFYKSRINQK